MKSANRTSIMPVKQAPELAGAAALVLQLVHGIERTLERHFWRWTALAVTMLLLSMIVIDLRKKLWIDELVTVYMAKQDGPAEIVARHGRRGRCFTTALFHPRAGSASTSRK